MQKIKLSTMRRSVAGMLILALTGCIAAGCGTITDRIRFGAAGLGGMYHAFADTFSDIAQSDEDYKMEVKTTAGSAAPSLRQILRMTLTMEQGSLKEKSTRVIVQ